MDGRSNFHPEEHNPATDRFVVALDRDEIGDSVAIVCGALRRFEDGVVEGKRMYVKPDVRGKGVGRALLAYLEAEAMRLGYTLVVLETGVLQPDALGLYESNGYTPVPPWPPYDTRDYSRCFEKILRDAFDDPKSAPLGDA